MITPLINKLNKVRKSFGKNALILDTNSESDIKKVAQVIKKGGIVAFPFNGIYGLFGDADNSRAANKIIIAKNRPKDKKLILVSLPEYIHEHIDLNKLQYEREKLINLWKNIHALGVILPAAKTAPKHLVINEEIDTILTIWTEYAPIRKLVEEFRLLGGRALVGTSANKNGQPTHYAIETLTKDFQKEVNVIVSDNFDDLPAIRRKSTTVIDLTNGSPVLHRLGNVEEKELKKALQKNGFPKLQVLRDVIFVRPRD